MKENKPYFDPNVLAQCSNLDLYELRASNEGWAGAGFVSAGMFLTGFVVASIELVKSANNFSVPNSLLYVSADATLIGLTGVGILIMKAGLNRSYEITREIKRRTNHSSQQYAIE